MTENNRQPKQKIKVDLKNTVFILGRGMAGIPHFRKKSPKLSDAARTNPPL